MEVATKVYYWDDGSIAAYGLSRGRPHRRVYCVRDLTYDRPVETRLVELLRHLNSNDSVQYFAGKCIMSNRRVKTAIVVPAQRDLFWNWVKANKPEPYLEAMR